MPEEVPSAATKGVAGGEAIEIAGIDCNLQQAYENLVDLTSQLIERVMTAAKPS